MLEEPVTATWLRQGACHLENMREVSCGTHVSPSMWCQTVAHNKEVCGSIWYMVASTYSKNLVRGSQSSAVTIMPVTFCSSGGGCFYR